MKSARAAAGVLPQTFSGGGPVQPGPPRLIMLDGLRGMAALAVLYYHLPNSLPGAGLFARGYLMVDLFFLLSGFVLALTAEPRLAGGLGGVRFMLARVRRLWPMIAVGAGLGTGAALIFLFDRGISLHELSRHGLLALFALFLVPSLIATRSNALFPLNGPHWSLLFEVIANFFHAFVLWRLNNRTLLMIAGVFAVLLVLSIYERGLNSAGPFFSNWHHAFPRLGFSYCIGIWLARNWRDGRLRISVPWPLALFLPLLGIITAAVSGIDQPTGDAVLVIIAFPLCLLLAVSSKAPPSAVPVLGWLGAISYPLYAVHDPLLKLAQFASVRPVAQALAAIVALALAAGLAAVFERRRKHRPLASSGALSQPIR